MFTPFLILFILFPSMLTAEETKSEKRQKLIKELCTSFQDAANQCKLVPGHLPFTVQNNFLGLTGPKNMGLGQVNDLFSSAKANFHKNSAFVIDQEIMNMYLNHASAHQKYIQSIPVFFKALSEYAPEALKEFYANRTNLNIDSNSQDACHLSEELSHVLAKAQKKYQDLYSEEFDQLEKIHDLALEYGEESYKMAESSLPDTPEKRAKIEELTELHAAFLELESRYLKTLHIADYKHSANFESVRSVVQLPLESKSAKENKVVQGFVKDLEKLRVKTELNSSVTEAYRQIENYDNFAFDYFKQYCYEDGKHVEWKDLSLDESTKLMKTKKLIPALKYCQTASVKNWFFESRTLLVYVYNPKEKKLLEVLPLERIMGGAENVPGVLEYTGDLEHMDEELVKKYPILSQYKIVRYVDCPNEVLKEQFSFGEVQEKFGKREELVRAYENVYITRREKERKVVVEKVKY